MGFNKSYLAILAGYNNVMSIIAAISPSCPFDASFFGMPFLFGSNISSSFVAGLPDPPTSLRFFNLF